MLPRLLRLKNPLSFQKAFRFGKPFFFGNIGCRILFRAGSGRKIGFVAAKKMFRHAVDRNQARRLLSEAVLPLVKSFPEDAHIVVFFRSRPEAMRLEDIKGDMRGLVGILSASVRKNENI